ALLDQNEDYLNSRADTMRNIEQTMVDLGQIFQQLATIVREQDEMVQRIDASVDQTTINVEGAHAELLKFFKTVSSNRRLMLKVFGVLIFRNVCLGSLHLGQQGQVIEKFMPLLMDREEEGSVQPVLPCEDVFFMYIKHSNVYIVATTKKNANAGLSDLEEESIRDNFVIVYELLDEVMGLWLSPRQTAPESCRSSSRRRVTKLELAPKLPPAVTNAVSLALSEGVKYRKNEVFLDVIENVNLMPATGNVLRSEIVGCIKMRDYLRYCPNSDWDSMIEVLFESTGKRQEQICRIGDVKFHQCVK
uniref:t-SNARE coiled-coil homology domain-containing protein n=1 Tax=Macrostomum lignano TaxID=282301 RepID=A0A1I8FSF3_9PLAT